MAVRKSAQRKKGLLASLASLLSRTYIGRLVLYLVAATLVCGFDLLVSGNDFTLFYQLVGAEFLLFAFALWAVYIIRKVRD
jgi:hypothetical protein